MFFYNIFFDFVGQQAYVVKKRFFIIVKHLIIGLKNFNVRPKNSFLELNLILKLTKQENFHPKNFCPVIFFLIKIDCIGF